MSPKCKPIVKQVEEASLTAENSMPSEPVDVKTSCPSPCEQLGKCEIPDEEFENIVEKEFGMDKEHARDMRAVCEEQGVTASFRASNPACLEWIRKGYPAKPCTVPNKTLSTKTLKVPPNTSEDVNKIEKLGIKGLVGVYDDDKKVIGVRTTTGHVYLNELPPIPANSYTGDYDLHDLINADGSRVKPEESKDMAIREALNDACGRGEGRGMVRHGDQANYPDYCKIHDKNMKHELVRPDPPVLVFDHSGKAYQIKDNNDLNSFYKCKGTPRPKEWPRENKSV